MAQSRFDGHASDPKVGIADVLGGLGLGFNRQSTRVCIHVMYMYIHIHIHIHTYIDRYEHLYIYMYTQRIRCSSFLVLTKILLGDYNILLQKGTAFEP